MLEVQYFLRHIGSLEDLHNTLAIKIKHHPSLPLVILNYDQLESLKSNKIVRECRGLVLHSKTYDIVARSFPRFFNWGEMLHEQADFVWKDCSATSKEDGSLCLIYYFDGRWRVNTRNGFGQDKVNFSKYTWNELACKALYVSDLNELADILVPGKTYVCELVSPYNKIVRYYPDVALYLLSIYNGADEESQTEVDNVAELLNIRRPEVFKFTSANEVAEFLQLRSKDDATFEGVVLRDSNNFRWKCKSATYVALHRLGSDKNSLFNPKNLIPLILAGERDEVVTYFPEVIETYDSLSESVWEMLEELKTLWAASHHIENQKEFALKIKDHRLCSVLFRLKKQVGSVFDTNKLREIFVSSEKLLVKLLTKERQSWKPLDVGRLGSLEVERLLADYDGVPYTYTARDKDGELLLLHIMESRNAFLRYLVVPISTAQLAALETGRLDLRQAIVGQPRLWVADICAKQIIALWRPPDCRQLEPYLPHSDTMLYDIKKNV